MHRRQFLKSAVTASGVVAVSPRSMVAAGRERSNAPALHSAPVRFDVTPPIGHSLCGGWIKPVSGFDDPLEAIGYVLLGAGKPIVFCAVDWTGILNDAHVQWRTALAEAAGTT